MFDANDWHLAPFLARFSWPWPRPELSSWQRSADCGLLRQKQRARRRPRQVRTGLCSADRQGPWRARRSQAHRADQGRRRRGGEV